MIARVKAVNFLLDIFGELDFKDPLDVKIEKKPVKRAAKRKNK
jgi:hypothetical protein